MRDQSPVKRLALNWFNDCFSDLCDHRVEFTQFEKSFIEGTMEILWLDHSKPNFKEIEKTARVTFYFLKEGSEKDLKKVVKEYLKVVDKLHPVLNDIWDNRHKVKQEEDEDKKVHGYLSLYKKIIEALASLCMAPPIFSFAVSKNSKDKSFRVNEDGRIKLSALSKIQKWLNYPESRLAIGINSHIRNSYSHEQYRILDDGYVELWDRDPHRPNKSWGPEIWHIDKLEKICDQLWFNCLGVCLGLVIYSLNYREKIERMGIKSPETTYVMRMAEIERVISVVADQLSFDAKDIQKNDGLLSMSLSTRYKGIDQVSDIIVGGKTSSRLFKQAIKYEEVGVFLQVLGFLQQVDRYLYGINNVVLSVSDEEGNSIGELEITTENIRNLKGPGKETLDDVRLKLTKNTITDKTMFVERESAPYEC